MVKQYRLVGIPIMQWISCLDCDSCRWIRMTGAGTKPRKQGGWRCFHSSPKNTGIAKSKLSIYQTTINCTNHEGCTKEKFRQTQNWAQNTTFDSNVCVFQGFFWEDDVLQTSSCFGATLSECGFEHICNVNCSSFFFFISPDRNPRKRWKQKRNVLCR